MSPMQTTFNHLPMQTTFNHLPMQTTSNHLAMHTTWPLGHVLNDWSQIHMYLGARCKLLSQLKVHPFAPPLALLLHTGGVTDSCNSLISLRSH